MGCVRHFTLGHRHRHPPFFLSLTKYFSEVNARRRRLRRRRRCLRRPRHRLVFFLLTRKTRADDISLSLSLYTIFFNILYIFTVSLCAQYIDTFSFEFYYISPPIWVCKCVCDCFRVKREENPLNDATTGDRNTHTHQGLRLATILYSLIGLFKLTLGLPSLDALSLFAPRYHLEVWRHCRHLNSALCSVNAYIDCVGSIYCMSRVNCRCRYNKFCYFFF